MSKRRNEERIQQLIAEGRIYPLPGSRVSEIRAGCVLLQQGAQVIDSSNDFVNVFVGGEPPFDFLTRIGVRFRGATDPGSIAVPAQAPVEPLEGGAGEASTRELIAAASARTLEGRPEGLSVPEIRCLGRGRAPTGVWAPGGDGLSERTRKAPSVLVVEDSQIVARDIERKLGRLGYRVAGSAVSGRAAIEKAAATRPDLVLMDIRLKGKMDGIEAAQEIRDRSGIPVIYLTAYADDETVERAKKTEPLAYLVKPFDESSLRTAMEVALFRASMERKLRESERWLRVTLRCMGDPTIVTDESGHVRFMNPAAESVTGWTEEGALGQPWWDVAPLLDPDQRRPTRQPVEEAIQADQTHVSRGVLLADRRGSESLVEVTAAPIAEPGATCVGVVIVLRDTSERTIAEQAVRSSADLQRAVLDSTQDAIFLLSMEDRFLLANAAAETLLGMPGRELVGRRVTEVLAPGVSNLISRAKSEALGERRNSTFTCAMTAGGVRGDYVVRVTVCRAGPERILGVLAVARHESLWGKPPSAGPEARTLGQLSHEIDRLTAGLEEALGATMGDDVRGHVSRIRDIGAELSALHWNERSLGGDAE